MCVPEKALDILHALGPRYTIEFISPEVPIGAFEVNDSENGTLSPTQFSAHTDSPRPGYRPDPMELPHPSLQGTTVHAQEPEVLSMLTGAAEVPSHVTATALYVRNLPSPKWPHTKLAFGDPAQYLGQDNRDARLQRSCGNSSNASRRRRRRYGNRMRSRNPPRPLLSRALYSQQMIQQDGYLQEGHDVCGSALDERRGLRVAQRACCGVRRAASCKVSGIACTLDCGAMCRIKVRRKH